VESSETPAENRATTSSKSSYLAAWQVNRAKLPDQSTVAHTNKGDTEPELGDRAVVEEVWGFWAGAYVDEILSLLSGGGRGRGGVRLCRFDAHLQTTRVAEEEETMLRCRTAAGCA